MKDDLERMLYTECEEAKANDQIQNKKQQQQQESLRTSFEREKN